MSNLEKEYKYYTDHQDELVGLYNGKYIVIKDGKVQGAYDTEIEAYEDAKSKFELGTFLIKPCLPKSSETPQVFHTRAYFK